MSFRQPRSSQFQFQFQFLEGLPLRLLLLDSDLLLSNKNFCVKKDLVPVYSGVRHVPLRVWSALGDRDLSARESGDTDSEGSDHRRGDLIEDNSESV